MAQTSQSKLVIPYCIELPEGLEPGNKLRIQGSVPNDSVSFMVNFLCGKQDKADNALLVLVKVEAPSAVMLNSFINNTLGEKEKFSNVPLARGQDFELEFVIEEDVYKVLVNGKEFCQWKHHISAKNVRFMQIEGSVELKAVNMEQLAAETETKIQTSTMCYCPPRRRICFPGPIWYCHSCRRTPCRCPPCHRCCRSPCRCPPCHRCCRSPCRCPPCPCCCRSPCRCPPCPCCCCSPCRCDCW